MIYMCMDALHNVIVSKLELADHSEFESHNVPHIYSLMPHLS